MYAHVLAGLDLVANVDLAGRIIAHQDDCEARLCAPRGELLNGGRGLGSELRGKGFTVNKLGAHVFKLSSRYRLALRQFLVGRRRYSR